MSNKKLNKNNVNYKKEMSESDKINKSNNVSNKEALKDKIHEIHNYLRNNGAGYGMNALKVFNLLYGLKKLEEKNLLDVSNLVRPQCEFSYLLSVANQTDDLKDERLCELIKGDVLDSIASSKIRELLFYEIPNNIKSKSLSYLIKEINKITIIEDTCNVLLSGKIYEYFIGRDESAISELGAYFTDRHIVDYIYKKLDPELNFDMSIDSMIDMFGGSGGFTTGYINYLNQKYTNINWSKNINKIYHYDMNSDVVKSAGLEIFCLTGELPNMEDNIIYKNSFQCEYENKKFYHIVTNPPYGGDKTKKSADTVKREKLKEYIKKDLLTLTDELKIEARHKQLKDICKKDSEDKIESDKYKVTLDTCSMRIRRFAKKHKLKANDKEATSLILIMDLLAADGVAIGVLKEGVFFNSTYKNIRKCLVENFNVTEVISVPQDQFENTSTKTSILIFNNQEYNDELVKFSELKIKKYEEDKFEEINDTIFITESKGDICDITEDLISEATKEEIINNKNHSLNGKDYNKTELKIGNDYQLVKLGDICEINPKIKLTKTKYKYIEIRDINNNLITNSTELLKSELPINAKNITEYGNILIACVRPKKSKMLLITDSIKNINEFVFSSALVNILPKDKKMSYYIYSILYNMVDDFEKKLCNGSSYPRFNPNDLIDLKIPIPKDEKKITYWVDKISKPYNDKNKAENELKELEADIKDKIKYICENEDCEEVELKDLVNVKSGEYITKDNMISGNYPVYGGGNISNYINKYNNENSLIINKDGVSNDCVKFEKEKFFLNHHGWVLEYKIIDLKNYINNWIINNQDKIYSLATGSAQKGIKRENFLSLKIKIPKDKELVTNLDSLFKKVEELQNNIKSSEFLYKQYINELSEEAIIV